MTSQPTSLPTQWLTEGVLDAEYKQYLFLAWLQRIRRQFDSARIYPALEEVIAQHRFLHAFEQARTSRKSQSKGQLKGIDWSQLQLVFERVGSQKHPELEAYFEACMEFALPELDRALDEGRDLFDWIEEHLEVTPVGLIPLYTHDGYMFIYDESQHLLRAYRYAKSWVDLDNDRLIQLSLEPIEQRYKLLSETFESIKLGLIRRYAELPNPATFLVRSTMGFPLQETLLPIAKRLLLKELQPR